MKEGVRTKSIDREEEEMNRSWKWAKEAMKYVSKRRPLLGEAPVTTNNHRPNPVATSRPNTTKRSSRAQECIHTFLFFPTAKSARLETMSRLEKLSSHAMKINCRQ